MKLNWLKQSHLLGAWWGNFKLVAQHTNIYIQVFILAFSGTAAYGVISGQLHEWGYTLPFWQFVVAVGSILFILALLEWKLSLPSAFISWNLQWWEHRNPLRKEIEEINTKLDTLLDAENRKPTATSVPMILKRKHPPRPKER